MRSSRDGASGPKPPGTGPRRWASCISRTALGEERCVRKWTKGLQCELIQENTCSIFAANENEKRTRRISLFWKRPHDVTLEKYT